MRLVAIISTPPGDAAAAAASVASIAPQVDKIVLILDPGQVAPSQPETASSENFEAVTLAERTGSAGRFAYVVAGDDQVLLCGDGIIYPPDYVARLRERWEAYRTHDAIVGVEGIVYSDFFDGDPESRLLHKATDRLDQDAFVNQLNTATIFCGAHQMPDADFAASGGEFTDLRFAIYCAQRNRPRISISRDRGWLMKVPGANAVASDPPPRRLPLDVIAQAQQIAGFRHLPAKRPGE